ncbi:dual oxidase maturation factor 1-like isoform X1 [Palaemon carinicauda]|uniref:dual oxidase maturation factor 1-like isoform X1 n=1 Tax=Palaemon carinicauda TaxID=392227 RepID=UPI0035B6888A
MSATEGHGPGLFRLGRVWPFPSIYPDWRTPVTQDVLLMGWVAAFFALLLPFYLVIPASNDKLSRAIRVTLFLLLGLSIMLCNFGQDWEVGFIRTRTQYKAGTADHIEADIGVKLGLRSVNITLKGKPQNESTTLAGETINYNERFTWAWAQGRSGFGPYAGQIQRDFRAAQQRGSPYPILWVAEYFTFDGEGIRFGRHYRTAGWYSHIALWAAFPTWVMTVLLFKMVVRYAALALVLIGILLVIPVLIWYSYRNPIELQIPFEDGILKTSFGWCFYLALVVGIACIVIGSVLFRLSLGDFEAKLTDFFGNNPWKLSEEVDYNVTGIGTRRGRERSVSMIEMERINTSATRFSPGLPLSPRSHGGDSRLTSSGSFSSRGFVKDSPTLLFRLIRQTVPPLPARISLLATMIRTSVMTFSRKALELRRTDTQNNR